MKRLTFRLAALTLLLISSLSAEHFFPLGIIGGQSSAPYAALVLQDGDVVTLPGLPPTGLTYRVGMTSYGVGLIGGTNGSNAYAAFVAQNGDLTPVSGLISPGEIYFVSINESAEGIVGGGRQSTNVPFAALVYQNGSSLSLPVPPSGLIYGTAIDSFGDGMICGIGPLDSAYAALTTKEGVVTPLSGLPTSGAIFWGAINDSKYRFIGGNDGASMYAAFVDPHGVLEPVSNLPSGQLYSVGMNEAGNGIIGGTSLNRPYAALVSRDGVVNQLQGLPSTDGIIYNTALNRTGTGLIAGFSTTGPFGAFVSPKGALTPLRNLPAGTGFLDGAALHSSGIALVGGEIFNTPFAALAAPNGNLVYLNNLAASGAINSTALGFLDRFVPRSIGPFDSWANTQFTLSNVLTQHLIRYKENCSDVCERSGCTSTSFWVSAFGNYVHNNVHECLPSYNNKIAGGVIGLDYFGLCDWVFGGALAYAHNNVGYNCDFGHTTINQESAVIYAAVNQPLFYVNASLWAGIFQIDHERYTFFTSKSSPSGWNLNPHIEVSTPFCVNICQDFVVDPYVMFDWAHNWINEYHEKGWHGFNLRVNEQHASVLRSEIGVRLFESFDFGCGCFSVQEKIGYVNKNPTHKSNARAHYIGADSTFEVQTLNDKVQNLAAVQLNIDWRPSSSSNAYMTFDYQGEYGCFSTANMLTFTLGFFF